ncbi:uncharacterized protein LOC129744303 [Uranotaenia lowii]|uniref:uncharacterized protein LOC129744303 n=1 Tax=Uranotaenia lowii TaxID=190385 RepID=UPI00247A6358|nr:uncharacterized protein LOC129744303 [Uranotaenia lowii]
MDISWLSDAEIKPDPELMIPDDYQENDGITQEVTTGTALTSNGYSVSLLASDEGMQGNSNAEHVPKKDKQKHSKDMLNEILAGIKAKRYTIHYAAKMSGVPRSTLRYRLAAERKGIIGKKGFTRFSLQEESSIAQWVQRQQSRGLPVTKKEISQRAKDMLDKKPRATEKKIRNGMPGRKWLANFLQRNEHITLTPESTDSSLNEKNIQDWFKRIGDYLEQEKVKDVLNDPTRILYGDETFYRLHLKMPKTKVVNPNDTLRSTVLFTFSAKGSIYPANVSLPVPRMSKQIADTFPIGWKIHQTDDGLMKTADFHSYILDTLVPALQKEKVRFPVLYFIQGFKSRAARLAADLCKELGIIIVGLYENSSNVLQPKDTSIFKPSNVLTDSFCGICTVDRKPLTITVNNFGKLIQDAMDTGITKYRIQIAFRNAGIYPFEATAVKFDKRITPNFADAELDTSDNSPSEENIQPTSGSIIPQPIEPRLLTPPNPPAYLQVPTKYIEQALDMIGEFRITEYLEQPPYLLSPEQNIIQYMYFNILAPHAKKAAAVKIDRKTDLNRESVFVNENPQIDRDNSCSLVSSDEPGGTITVQVEMEGDLELNS